MRADVATARKTVEEARRQVDDLGEAERIVAEADAKEREEAARAAKAKREADIADRHAAAERVRDEGLALRYPALANAVEAVTKIATEIDADRAALDRFNVYVATAGRPDLQVVDNVRPQLFGKAPEANPGVGDSLRRNVTALISKLERIRLA